MNRLAVISRFNENLDWVNELKISYLIYNKGENNIHFPSTLLPNTGREGNTYLTYIIKNYNNLPEEIAFLQGKPFDHCEKILTYLNNPYTTDITYQIDNKVIFLMNKHQEKYYLECDINGNDINGNIGHSGLPIKEILDQIGIYYRGPFIFSQGAQYLISKICILSKPLNWWENIYQVYNNNPSSPWVFERIWPLIYASEI